MPATDKTLLRQMKEAYHIGMLLKMGPAGASALELSLQAYADRKLFQVGIYSDDHWKTIMNFLRINTPECVHAVQQLIEDNGNVIANVPTEIHHLYLDLMNVVDLTKMAATCKFYHEVANDKITRWMNSFFETRDIKWDEFRFAMLHTEVILSGMAVNHLIFPGESARTLVQSNKIECYLTNETLSTFRQYLDVATNYRWVTNVDNPRHMISKSVIYKHKTPHAYPFKIFLNVCEDNDPEAAVVRQQFTANANWISANGLMVLDTELTLSGFSLPVRESISLDTPGDLETLRRKSLELSDNGIQLLTYHDPLFTEPSKATDSRHGQEGNDVHANRTSKQTLFDIGDVGTEYPGDQWKGRCSGNPTCPSKMRNTEDGSSFFAAFQKPVLGLEARYGGQQIGLAWSLGNTGCDGVAPSECFATSYKISREGREDRPTRKPYHLAE
ncbi:hypothetical protein C8R43DRAFT_949163 [Mycena crocata]|nr:hypothetical protein C8R43DRAFT_949163 [Mycena crocata]